MSYELYQTEGIILDYKNIGEADRIFSVFTKDFGRIELFAKGARLLKSKLRCHLDLFSYLRLSFINGKECWRMVDAQKIYVWKKISKFSFKVFAAGQSAALLNRMIKGEEKDFRLWSLIKSTFIFLDEELERPDLREFKMIFAFRLFFELGYVDYKSGFFNKKKILARLLKNQSWDSSLLKEANKNRLFFQQTIKNAFEASGL